MYFPDSLLNTSLLGKKLAQPHHLKGVLGMLGIWNASLHSWVSDWVGPHLGSLGVGMLENLRWVTLRPKKKI